MSNDKISPLKTLESIFQKRRLKNPKYSLRAFSRDLNISPGRLSVIMAGKSDPGQRFIAKILECKSLTAEEKSQFEVALKNYLGYSDSISHNFQIHSEPSEELDAMEVHSIFCLLRTANCSADHGWIAKRMGLKKEAVNSAITAMLKHGIITLTNGKYRPTTSGLEYQEQGKSGRPIGEYYQKYLINTLPSILEMDRAHSLFGAMIFSLDKEDIPKVKKILELAIKKVHALSDKSKRTEVYNLSFVTQRMSKDVE